MKEIKAVIRPTKLPKIRSAFRYVRGFPGMTVTKVEGCGTFMHDGPRNIREELTEYTPKVRIEIVAPDEMVEGILQVLVDVAATGQRGDGIIWVTDATRMVRLCEVVSVQDD